MSAPLGHDPLAADLALHLMRDGQHWCWLNIELGSHKARPDIFAMRRWAYHHPSFVAFEVKTSVSDLRSDLTGGKWQKYREVANAVTFAVPNGLCKPADLPAECGLIVRSERGWAHKRRPTLRPIELSQAAIVKLLSSWPVRPHELNAQLQPNLHNQFGDAQRTRAEYERRAAASIYREAGKRYGRHIAEMLRAPDYADKIVAQAKEEADRILKSANQDRANVRQEWDALGEICGIKPGATAWSIRCAVHDLARQLTADGVAAERGRKLDQIRKLLDSDEAVERLAATPPGEAA